MPVTASGSSESMLRLRTRRSYRPREITANVPADMLDPYLRQRLRRADEELAAAHADADDARVAEERLHGAKAEGTVPWEAIKDDLGL